MILAFFQNMGFWDLVFIASLIYLMYSRAGLRSNQPPPASSGNTQSESRSSNQSALSDCYTILEVPETASVEQIRESYKNLVKVWHPDRFPNDAKLREKADHKLKQINAAYEKVMAARK